MRKLAFFAAVAATLCTVACNKDLSGSKAKVPVPSDDGRVEVTLTVTGGPMTKSADQDIDDNLSVVHNIQFFAFNEDESIDTYVKVTDGMSDRRSSGRSSMPMTSPMSRRWTSLRPSRHSWRTMQTAL